MRTLLAVLATAMALTAYEACANPECPGTPAGKPLPLKLGRLTLSASAPAVTSATGAVAFNGRTLTVSQPPGVVGVQVQFQTGTVGDVDVVEKDAKGAVIRSFTLLTKAHAPRSIIYPIVTLGAANTTFASQNNEGEIRSLCEIQ